MVVFFYSKISHGLQHGQQMRYELTLLLNPKLS